MAEIIYDMPFKDYLKHPGLSSHQAMCYMRSPAHYLYNLQNPKPSTPAMAIGRAVHKLFLEPETFEDEFVVCPDFDKRTNDGRNGFKEFESTAEGKEVIKSKDMELVNKMVTALNRSQAAIDLRRTWREVSIFFSVGDVYCKSRLDALDQEAGMFYDLKTAEDADPESFRSDFFRYKYPFQMAFYMLAAKSIREFGSPGCMIHAVSKSEPITVTRHLVYSDVMEFGLAQVLKALETHRVCTQNQSWPNYDSREANKITLR